eukprot:233499-Chlamydomonas_euryale.AAC.1
MAATTVAVAARAGGRCVAARALPARVLISALRWVHATFLDARKQDASDLVALGGRDPGAVSAMPCANAHTGGDRKGGGGKTGRDQDEDGSDGDDGSGGGKRGGSGTPAGGARHVAAAATLPPPSLSGRRNNYGVLEMGCLLLAWAAAQPMADALGVMRLGGPAAAAAYAVLPLVAGAAMLAYAVGCGTDYLEQPQLCRRALAPWAE